MKEQYTVSLTPSQVFFLECAIGSKILDLCKGRVNNADDFDEDYFQGRMETATELAGIFRPLGEQIVSDYEDGLVGEFKTHMDKGLEELLG